MPHNPNRPSSSSQQSPRSNQPTPKQTPNPSLKRNKPTLMQRLAAWYFTFFPPRN